MRRLALWATILGFACATAQARQSPQLRPGLITPGGLPAFFDSQGPLAYAALTRRELPKDAVLMGPVTGRSCQYSLAIPLALSLQSTSISGAAGNGGYARVLRDIERQHPGIRGIYDAKVDLHLITVLGLFGKLCTEMTAEGYR